jgi:hypothetical protein
MPATLEKNEQQYKVGDLVQFIKYDGDTEGELQAGDQLKVTGYDPEQELYNVVRVSDDQEDSLFDVEFEAATKKATRRAKQEPVEEAVVAKKATKTAKQKPATEPVEEPANEAVEKKAPKAKAQKDQEPEVKAEKQKPSKKADKPEATTEEELPEFVETSSVTAALELHDGDELATASTLAEQKEKTIFTLGGVLARIKRNDSFSSIVNAKKERSYEDGLKGFNNYVKDELGVESRSAAYYVDLYEMFSQVTSEEKIAKIGWTKLRELLPLKEMIDDKNVDGWLKKAKEVSTKELHDAVTKQLVDAGEKTHGNRQMAEQTTFKYVVHNDQATTITEAIMKAKDIIGDDCSDGAALVHILTEWLQLADSE